jgi:hypothetical protein
MCVWSLHSKHLEVQSVMVPTRKTTTGATHPPAAAAARTRTPSPKEPLPRAQRTRWLCLAGTLRRVQVAASRAAGAPVAGLFGITTPIFLLWGGISRELGRSLMWVARNWRRHPWGCRGHGQRSSNLAVPFRRGRHVASTGRGSGHVTAGASLPLVAARVTRETEKRPTEREQKFTGGRLGGRWKVPAYSPETLAFEQPKLLLQGRTTAFLPVFLPVLGVFHLHRQSLSSARLGLPFEVKKLPSFRASVFTQGKSHL